MGFWMIKDDRYVIYVYVLNYQEYLWDMINHTVKHPFRINLFNSRINSLIKVQFLKNLVDKPLIPTFI